MPQIGLLERELVSGLLLAERLRELTSTQCKHAEAGPDSKAEREPCGCTTGSEHSPHTLSIAHTMF